MRAVTDTPCAAPLSGGGGVGCGSDQDGAGGGGGEAGLVGGDVVNGVGCGFCRVYEDVARESAVEIGRAWRREVGRN